MSTGGPSSTRAAVSGVLRQWWWFPHVRRIQHEGLRRAYQRRRRWNPILRSPAARTAPISWPAPYEVHVLCCLADYVSAIWALKSLLVRGGVRAPLYLHLQGHTTRRMRAALRRHFPDALLITQDEADRRVVSELGRRNLRRLAALRATSPIMLKLVDVALFGTNARLLLLDSDVLFFRSPDELIAAASEPGRSWFQQDTESCYVISRQDASTLDVDLQPRLNTGLVAIDRKEIDLERCERYLAHEAFLTQSGWVEQTLYALLASASGAVSLLPPIYAISPAAGPTPDDLVARHYSGASRCYLTSQGIPWLVNEGRVLNGGTGTSIRHASP